MNARLPLRDPNAPVGAIARTSAESPDLKVSFEFFPPKNQKMEDKLWTSIEKLAPLSPDFVSVTYGAGGSTRERTHRTVARMVKETDFAPAAHLTCVGATRDEIDQVARDYWDAGVRHIVALRGDPSDGIGETYKPHPGGYAYADDLTLGLKKIANFEVSVSAYPEQHPESANWSVEIDNLKRKIDAGATRAITQFFFSPDIFWRFQDRVLDAGIDIPIVPGDPVTRDMLTATLAAELTAELRDRGVDHFHLYTLNRAEIAVSVSRVLGLHQRQSKCAEA